MVNTVKRKIAISIANPSGNITAFVLSGAMEKEYAGIAKSILAMDELKCEQVAFVTGTRSIDMSGMEFCGNAARAFALMTAKGMIDGKKLPGDTATLEITVSGSEKPLIAEVDMIHDYAKIEMPKPKRIKELKHCEFEPAIGKSVVVMKGIVHLIADGIEYTEENFELIKKALIEEFDPPALGVMYLDTGTLTMKPVVYVKEIGSTYVEGSCGSGSVAATAFLTNKEPDGKYEFDLLQPAGSLHTSASMIDGKLDTVYIEGAVDLGEPMYIDIEYEAPPLPTIQEINESAAN